MGENSKTSCQICFMWTYAFFLCWHYRRVINSITLLFGGSSNSCKLEDITCKTQNES